MRVVQINTVYKKNSTGRTCWEVEKALVEKGYDCLTIHQLGLHIDDEHDYIVNGTFGYYIHKLFSRVIGLDGYYSRTATKRAIEVIKTFNPDLIHLRNLHGGYINLPELYDFLKTADIPVIYNLHDTWAYTGKCPEYDNVKCEKWKSECKECPQYRRYPRSWFFDRSRKMYNDKKNWYKGIRNLTVVGVSDYMKSEALKSPLFENRRIERIYNWIDLDTFRPKQDVNRKKYGLPEGFLVIGVSSYWKKNTEYEEICELAGTLQGQAHVCLVGGDSLELPYSNMIHIPFTESVEELACLYSTADVFVSLSTAESFGKVAAEAIACGTPAVVYNTTGIAEIPKDGCGYVVAKHSIEEVKKAVLKVKENGKESYQLKCRSRAETEFSYLKNVEQLINLYREVSHERTV